MTSPTLDHATGQATPAQDPSIRRTRLREFQSQLMERMQAANSGVLTQANHLAVMIGQTRWLLSLHEAGEIVSVGAIAKVPLTKDWFLGLTNVRGNLLSVVDLACFHGMPSVSINKESRIIAFSPALSFNCGLLVSRVLGLRNLADLQPEANLEGTDATWGARRYMDRESQVWIELNLSLMVQNPQFLHVGL